MASDSEYDLKPSKEAYQAVKADVTPVSGIQELIDNALDNWQRTSQKLDDLLIEIDYEESEDDDESGEIIIRDNSGGVPEDDVSMLFALGQSAKDQITGSIGAYGVGAKKAILNLGNRAVIKSRSLHEETGFGFTIDQEWLKAEDDWTVDKEEFTDIGEGVTEIRISQLNADWDDFREDLREGLAKTYRFFLDDEHLTDIGDLEITVEGDKITSPDRTDWSYLPLDGFHPRRYEGIEIDSRDLTDTVYVDVEVGVLQKADNDAAGAEIYCQNRQVLDTVQDERAGFKTGSGSTRLSNFTGNHRRLKVLIEFYTEGDARELPWDAQKSDIDRYHKVTQAALDWVRRIVKPYHELAGDYETFPTTFGRPYTEDHPHAHAKEIFGYGGGRERVTHKPNTSYDDCTAIHDQLERTEPLKLRSYGDLEDLLHPAYDEELERRLNKDADSDVELDDIPVVEDISDADGIDIDTIVQELRKQAKRDVDEERRLVDLPEWQQPLYDWHLKTILTDERSDDEDPLTFDDLEETTSDDIETEDDDDEENRSGVSFKRTSPPEQQEQERDGDQESDDAGSGDGDQAITDFESEVTDTDDDTTPLGDDPVDSETLEDPADTSEDVHMLPIPEDEWEGLREALNVDEDASNEEVVEKLLEKLSLMQQLTA